MGEICHTHVYDYSFAVVMVVDDRVEVVLAGVLRILVHARILVDRQLRQRPEGKWREYMALVENMKDGLSRRTRW